MSAAKVERLGDGVRGSGNERVGVHESSGVHDIALVLQQLHVKHQRGVGGDHGRHALVAVAVPRAAPGLKIVFFFKGGGGGVRGDGVVVSFSSFIAQRPKYLGDLVGRAIKIAIVELLAALSVVESVSATSCKKRAVICYFSESPITGRSVLLSFVNIVCRTTSSTNWFESAAIHYETVIQIVCVCVCVRARAPSSSTLTDATEATEATEGIDRAGGAVGRGARPDRCSFWCV